MRVFISHASTDAKLAKRVVDALKEAGFQPWDDTLVLPGDNWGMDLAEALQESNAMVVLLTPDALRSPNINHEVSYALGKEGYKGRLIPVLAAPPEQLPKEEIPWILRSFPMIRLLNQDGDEEGLIEIVRTLKDAEGTVNTAS